MRFKHKPKHIHGKSIIRTWFAWWPIKINHETRWLERVSVEGYWFYPEAIDYWYWYSIRFVDNENLTTIAT